MRSVGNEIYFIIFGTCRHGHRFPQLNVHDTPAEHLQEYIAAYAWMIPEAIHIQVAIALPDREYMKERGH